ncbi:hypothetical protein ZYGR_0AD00950 [Zygosaccharomyces rouxii]|uniref:ZYRO0G08074p n=2 Tax=Zygosaccharomyces rouxii TaxID=4956 RepID=C5DZX9_ZYGRC|nr:uncharacterized protein ZYRO0G08074g [Zygosaccharomyces rouxii]KAH9202409.1 nucleoporin autopeptidase-domain-containing protein [Zygosaccharomyces rouxii]GAV50912.1 hypothetical protein ZYGR_0AD00950 [Zygosaccharomyces rouxii]CAR29413.1 ZYRO0G08074p [Zygosaccharomyces rouxii]
MFNRNTNGGFLFGNANTSTPTSTPTPAPNSLQVPQKSGNLFGNANANLGVSTPSPSGGLFGNSNTQAGAGGGGGLFGNQSTTNKPLFSNGASTTNNTGGSSLFGNTNTNTNTNTNANTSNNTTAPSTFSFGNNASKTNNNSSGGLFSNSGNQPTGGLFGNKPTASGGLFGGSSAPQPQQQQPPNGNITASNPYGLNINNIPIPSVSDMPAPITSSKGNKQGSESSSSGTSGLISSGSVMDGKRNFSLSSSSPSNLPTTTSLPSFSHSSLVNKLSARLKTVNQASAVQGLFSPSRNKLWDNHETGGVLTSNSSEYKPTHSNNTVLPSKGLSPFPLQKGEVSDLRKLKIDPNRSAAKKVKLLSGMAATTKSFELDDGTTRNWDIKKSESRNSSVSNLNNTDTDEFSSAETKVDGEEKPGNTKEEPKTDYWCSPSLEKLSHLPMNQLSIVPDFVIGRKGYGCITFNREVDLTAFAPNLEEELFGRIVVFHPTKTVEVYPEESKKAPIGHGLNVPATITLENIYPVDRKTKKPLKDGSRSDEVQLLIKRLKNMRDMEFISYNPFGGIWTFKVNHFSIWGVVNEEDVEVDTAEVEKLKNENMSNRTLAFPKNKRKLVQSNAQGFTHSPKENGDRTQNDLLALQDQSGAEATDELVEDENGDDLFLEEKPYEPDVSEQDFAGMEVEPSLNVSTDWVTQLKLAGSSLQSIFAAPKDLLAPGNDEIDMLFNEFNQSVELKKKIKKERKLTSPLNFAKFCCDSKFLVKDSHGPVGAKLHNLLLPYQRDVAIVNSLFRKQLKGSVIMERQSNAYPVVTQNSLQFKDVMELHGPSDPDYQVWKLCSLLFDAVDLPDSLDNEEVKANLLKKERHRLLCSWIVDQVQEEIDAKLKKTTNALDQIFLYLAKNDIVGASQLAIKSQNGHIAILISLLGSNDPGVCQLASLQLDKWNSAGNKVDSSVARIYRLLTGDLVNGSFLTAEMMSEFNWLALLGVVLYYGKIDEFSLEDLINHFFRYFKKPENDIFLIILSLFSTPSSSEALLKKLKLNTTALESLFPWYFAQILRFGTAYKFSNVILDQLTLTSIEELKFANLHEEALLATCFLSNDFVAQQQIDSLVFHNIKRLSKSSNGYILDRLKISTKLIYQAKALNDKYNSNYLSEAKHLLKAKSFEDAEKVIVTLVGPRLVIQGASTRLEELEILRTLLSSFPQNEMENWESGLGVFDNFLKLILDKDYREELFSSLISGLSLLHQANRFHKEVPVCCNIMAQELVTTFINEHGGKLDDNTKGKLLRLPLGQPEKVYLECMLAKTV